MRLYFAAVETQGRANTIAQIDPDDGPRQIFSTYYHLRTHNGSQNSSHNLLKYLKAKRIRTTIDSGTFSFMQEALKSGRKEKVKSSLDRYANEYVDWAKRAYPYFDFMVELDLHHVIGYDEVKKYRNHLRKSGFNRKLWICYHATEGFDDFKRVVDESKWENGGSGYCGIEGKNMLSSGQIDYDRCCRYAYKHGVCVHAFASTRVPFLKDFPLASADSSSYLLNSRYGVTSAYDSLTMGVRTFKNIDRGRQYIIDRSRAWSRGFGGRKEVSVYNDIRLLQTLGDYMLMQKSLTDYWKLNGVDWEAVEAENQRRRNGTE